MTEQMPGELIYEYTIKSTGVTAYGVPALDVLLAGPAGIPPQGARYDLTFEGPIVGRRIRGTVKLADYVHVRPDGRIQLHIHAEITAEDGEKIALYADGVAAFDAGSPLGDLRENVTLTTAEPDYAWVNSLQIWARGTVDLARGEARVAGYVV
jgi:predicted naringenin-chalcone synthase